MQLHIRDVAIVPERFKSTRGISSLKGLGKGTKNVHGINYTCKTVNIFIIKWRKYGTIWTFPGTGSPALSQNLHASVGKVTEQFHVKIFQKSKA